MRDYSKPCPYVAGSEQRINTYAERYERGLPLYHPEDMTIERSDLSIARKQLESRWFALLTCEPTPPECWGSTLRSEKYD